MTFYLARALAVQERFERFFGGLLRDKAGIRVYLIIRICLCGAQIVLGLSKPARGFALWVFHRS